MDMKFKKGDKVKVAEDNDNENYNEFRNKVLVITHADNKGIGYDDGVYPQGLYCFDDEEGNSIPCSLYDYELEEVFYMKDETTREELKAELKDIDSSFIWYMIGRLNMKYSYDDWLRFIKDFKKEI